MAKLTRPAGFSEACNRLQATLPDTMFVGSGYGYGDGNFDKQPCWFIRVSTDDADTSMVPTIWEGHPVYVGKVPRAL